MKEYWITKRGRIIPVTDRKNHVFVVIKYCVNKLRDKLCTVRGPYEQFASRFIETVEYCLDDDGFDATAMRCYVYDSIDEWVEEGLLTQEESQDIHSLLERLVKCDKPLLDIIFGYYDDPREYGIEHLEWTRVSYGIVTAPVLTQTVCDSLLKIYDGAFGGLLDIEIGFGGRRFMRVPKSALLDHRLIESNQYHELNVIT